MWDKLRTRMRLGELASEPPNECIDRNVGCSRGEAGDDWLYPCGSEFIGSAIVGLPLQGCWE